MSTYGTTPLGFFPKDMATCRDELVETIRTDFGFGPGLDFNPTKRVGRLVNSLADREALLWDAVQGVAAQRTVAGAGGAWLDAVVALTGTPRLPARASVVSLRLTGTPGTVVPAGSAVAVPGVGTRFVTQAAVVLVLTGGVGQADVLATCTQLGAVQGLAGTVTEIKTPVSGWATATNPLDAQLGADQETDAALRLRREQQLQSPGGASVAAVRAAVSAVPGVTAVRVFENVYGTTDAAGVPGHAFEVVARGGTEAAIRAAIWAAKPAGVQAWGTLMGTTPDEAGVPQAVGLSRPVVRTAWAQVAVVRGPLWPRGATPAEQAALDAPVLTTLKAALVAATSHLDMGDDVSRTSLFAPLYAAQPGLVEDVVYLWLSLYEGGEDENNLVVGPREVIVFDTTRIQMVVV